MRVLLDRGVKFNIDNLPELYEQVSDNFITLFVWNELFYWFRPCIIVYSCFDWSDLYNGIDVFHAVYVFQTISCQDCKFKEKDCLHFKWILNVSCTIISWNKLQNTKTNSTKHLHMSYLAWIPLEIRFVSLNKCLDSIKVGASWCDLRNTLFKIKHKIYYTLY